LTLILHIETATPVCSVALSRAGQLVGIRESGARNSHSSVVTLFIRELFEDAGLALSSLDAISISEGPGSYTGLRIGVASAKGLCYALDKPLIGIPTLQVMGYGMRDAGCEIGNDNKERNDLPRLFCPMIDARRMEVFCALFDEEGKEVRETKAEIIDENSFSGFLEKNTVIFAGDGALKCMPSLGNHPNACFLTDFNASARYMIRLAEEKFSRKEFEDLAYFEPFYLKDFVAGKPRVKGLR
jgi:tRNA threonylcarbamoyladenosine biosynthesis protein TsaB